MDTFGIGNAIKTSLNLVENAARRTGRTSRLLESLKTGDRVFVLHAAEGEKIRRLAHEAGKDISFTVVDPANVGEYLYGSKDRIKLDHSLVSAMYEYQVKATEAFIDRVENANIQEHRYFRATWEPSR